MSFKCLDISEVEAAKWEKLLDKSENASFYMCLDYLKLMHHKWFVLVSVKGDEYEFALPIPYKSLGFFSFALQPLMLQRFSLLRDPQANPDAFLQFATRIIYKKLHYFRLSFDKDSFELISKHLNVEAHTHLNLYCETQQEVESSYSTNHKRNIQKAKKQGLNFLINEDTQPVLEGFFKEKISSLKTSEDKLKHVESMITKFTSTGHLKAVHAFDEHGERVAACLMFIFRDTATFILSYSNGNGKKMGAMHGIVDYWLQGAGKEFRILDFEGGNIDNLKRFYLGFGAKEENYFSALYYRPYLQGIFRLIHKYK